MNDFFQLGSVRFGVDASQSHFRAVDPASFRFGVDPRKPSLDGASPLDGEMELHLEIYADKASLRAAQEDEDSQWSWALYPPEFYLRCLPIINHLEADTVEIAVAPSSEYEMALYMMEHNDVRDVVVRLIGWSRVEITGKVDVMGEQETFSIAFTAPQSV